MNRHINSFVSFLGLLCFVHYDIVGFYVVYKILGIRKYSHKGCFFIKLATIILGVIVFLIPQANMFLIEPAGVFGNVICGALLVYFGRLITVKSNYFYFQFDGQFFKMWNDRVRNVRS